MPSIIGGTRSIQNKIEFLKHIYILIEQFIKIRYNYTLHDEFSRLSEGYIL